MTAVRILARRQGGRSILFFVRATVDHKSGARWSLQYQMIATLQDRGYKTADRRHKSRRQVKMWMREVGEGKRLRYISARPLRGPNSVSTRGKLGGVVGSLV